jgi:hypothetical protein
MKKSLCAALFTLLCFTFIPSTQAQCSNDDFHYLADWWKWAKSASCEYWNGKKELRCIPLGDTSIVTVYNKGKEDITFYFSDWNGTCPSLHLRHSECFKVPKGGTRQLRMLSIQGSPKCRESYIYDCRKTDGTTVDCQDHLFADVVSYKGNL